MQVTVSRVSPVEVSLQVSIPKERVSTAFEKAYQEVARKAHLRGFRPGKAPRSVLRQAFGDKIAADLVRTLIDETLPSAITTNKIDMIGQPRVDTLEPPKDQAEWSYTASVETRPEITNVDLSTLSLTRKVYAIDDHDIGHVLDQRRDENATLRTPDPMRPAQNTDSATFDYQVFLEGEALKEFAAHGRTVELGKGLLLKELEEGLIGMNPGETKDVPVTFPEGQRQKEIAGKTTNVKLTLSALQEKVLPALDDEFAKDVGAESLDALKAKIRADLEKEYKAKSDDEVYDQAIDQLVKANPIAVPPSLTNMVIQDMRQQMARSLSIKVDQIPPSMNETFKPEAEQRVQAGLLIGALATQNNLLATNEDLDRRLEEMATETGRAIQRLRVEYRDAQKRELLASQVVERKVLEFLVSKATVKEETAATHDHDHEHGHGGDNKE